MTSDFGVWVEGVDGLEESIFLVYGSKNIMKEIFGNVVKRIPAKLVNLSAESASICLKAGYAFGF
jgi:hypothetical protein